MKKLLKRFFKKRRRVKSLRRRKKREAEEKLSLEKLRRQRKRRVAFGKRWKNIRKKISLKKLRYRRKWKAFWGKIWRGTASSKKTSRIKKISVRVFGALVCLAFLYAIAMASLLPGITATEFGWAVTIIVGSALVFFWRKSLTSLVKDHPMPLGILVSVILLVFWFNSGNSHNRSVRKPAPIPLSQQDWTFTWTIIKGLSKNGYETMTTRDVTVNELTPNLFDFTLHYYQGNQPQETHLRWDKSATDKGTWKQDNPPASGTFVLYKEAEGVYTGTSYGSGRGHECIMNIVLRRVR